MATLKHQTIALAREVSQTPRKIGLVAALVRGRSVADAQVILQHVPKRAALPVIKVIASASANATHNDGLQESSLIIKHLEVTSGPRQKRFRPSAMGRASGYQKRSANIRVVVEGTVKPKKKPTTKEKTS